ncbi:uncharacterized protein LOC114956047 isoform X2 [Acropora millepora]|uniref:uncharacterized protein LOC114956047 isoform X2 n=1 Tax=Acropora millepora TaxID=45264 RepID=UPI001CF383E1|nr:uncharacterized protein LOC114956047 isoform X2 [Acropora millepora]
MRNVLLTARICQNELTVKTSSYRDHKNLITCDENYEFPRKSLDALASLGLLGLIVPKALGGLGQNHACAAMVVETIARYGCSSTAMVYVMHLGAVASMLFRHHNNNTLQDVLRRLDKDRLVGTLVFSDPATGGHNWFPFSSKAKQLDDNTIQVLRYGAWVTSAGFADFYVVECTSPSFDGDFMNLSLYLMFKDEVRSSVDDWSALGMRGNQSSPVVCEGVLTADRLIGSFGEFPLAAHEVIDPYFLLFSSACWNGIALGAIDIAKKHVKRTEHADMGLRVADFPIIQDYFGKCLTETNCSRMMLFSVAQGMDDMTNNNDWSIYQEPIVVPIRGQFHHWCFQVKIKAATNVAQVTDDMLHACGGVGYKKELGLERLLRDGKAGWVMGASNEVLRQLVGKTSLFGLEAIDFWCKVPDSRALNFELKKLTGSAKRELARKLLNEAEKEDKVEKNQKCLYEDLDFDNPFSNRPPAILKSPDIQDGIKHARNPCLNPNEFVTLRLLSVKSLSEVVAEYTFALPQATDFTGCFPGQYVRVRLGNNQRFLSPVSRAKELGKISLLLKHETHGIFSNSMRSLKIGDTADFSGPCGGYEYQANSTCHLTLLASAMSCQPALQIVREITANPSDQTSVCLLLHANKPADIPYRQELQKYSVHDHRIQVSFTVTEVDCDDWAGGEGYIDSKLLSSKLPSHEETSHRVLVCGGPRMIMGVLQGLRELGYSSEKIFVYGQFGVQQIRAVYGKFTELAQQREKENNNNNNINIVKLNGYVH